MYPNKATTRGKGGRRKVARPAAKARSLEPVVGPEVYRVWVEMLSRLGQDGRTHRLAVLVASMLQHASSSAAETSRRRRGRDADADQDLLTALQEAEPGGENDELAEALVRLFKDAGVRHSRTNRRGDEYSLVEASIDEFIRWFDMPWVDVGGTTS